MHIKIESGAEGYILIFLSCLFLVIYIGILFWQNRNEKNRAAEDLEIIKRLRETEKRIFKKRDRNIDSTWKFMD